MDTDTCNCINVDTYTENYPILIAGRVLTLIHLAAKDSFEDACWCLVIIVTLCVIVRAITGTCTTCGDNTTTISGCKSFRGCDAAGSNCTIVNHIYLSRGTCTISMSRWRDAFALLPALDLSIRLVSPTLGFSRRQPSCKCSRRGLLGARAYVGHHLSSSVELAVSRIFHAGAGWQTASIVAGNLNLSSSSAALFITVGLGGLLGIFIGHTLLKLLKKTLSKYTSISLKSEVQTATLLGIAAFFPGSTWQPALNMMNAMKLSREWLLKGKPHQEGKW